MQTIITDAKVYEYECTASSSDQSATGGFLFPLLFAVFISHLDIFLILIFHHAVYGICYLTSLRQLFFHNHFSNMQKYFLHISANFSRSFKECQSMLISQLFAPLSFNYLILSIAFIRYQHFSYVLICMLVDLLQPVGNVVKGLLVCAIVHQYYSHCPLVICLCYRTETLLSCSIPHL